MNNKTQLYSAAYDIVRTCARIVMVYDLMTAKQKEYVAKAYGKLLEASLHLEAAMQKEAHGDENQRGNG